jgi:hypothetical protein
MRDRLLRALARGVARWSFRSVEVTGEADLHGPVIPAVLAEVWAFRGPGGRGGPCSTGGASSTRCGPCAAR